MGGRENEEEVTKHGGYFEERPRNGGRMTVSGEDPKKKGAGEGQMQEEDVLKD